MLQLHKYRQSNPVHRNDAISVLTFVEQSEGLRPACGLSPEEQMNTSNGLEPSSLLDYARHQEFHLQNLHSNPPGLELHRSEGATSLPRKGSGTDGHRVWIKAPTCCRSGVGRKHISDLLANAREIHHAPTQPYAARSCRADRSKIPEKSGGFEAYLTGSTYKRDMVTAVENTMGNRTDDSP